jgi:phage/plasmid-like protein (TIGR03299 family)
MPANVETCVVGRGISAWHNIGEVAPGLLTAKEAYEKGGQNWTVELHPSAVNVGGVYYPNKDKYSIVRMDNMRVLGDGLTDRYALFQNQGLYDLAEAVTGGHGEAHFETAGVLDEGRRVWTLCSLADSKDVTVAGDKVQPYFLITNGHDGKNSLICTMTPVRVVCQNTLTLALKGAKRQFKARHIGTNMDAESLAAAASDILGMTRKYYDTFESFAGELLEIKVSKTERDFLINELLLPEKENLSKKGETILKQAREQVLKAINAHDLQNFQGTAWQVYNGVVDYSDHMRGIKKREADPRGANEREAIRTVEDNVLKDTTQQYLMSLA